MEPVIIPQEQFSAALNWINGVETGISEQDVKSLIDKMAVGYRRRYRELYPFGARPHLQTTMTNLPTIENICGPEVADMFAQTMKQMREEKEAAAGAEMEKAAERHPDDALKTQGVVENPSEMLDSVLLINSISHVARDAGQAVTSSRAQIILYCIYGSHLAHTGIRLETEHPQAWKYGPVFPRAYKKGNLGDEGRCSESYSILREQFPEIAVSLSNKTSSMLFTPMVDLNACHKGKSSPYGKTVARNPDRWGVQIDDGLIKEFFQGNKHNRQIII